MKIKAFVTLSLLLLLFVAATRAAQAQNSGTASSGTWKFTMDDGSTKSAQFDARNQPDGTTIGTLAWDDDATIITQDVDGTGEPEQKIPGYSMSVQFDGLSVVNKNQAVMSGTVTDSTYRDLIGQRVLLTVEDNGDNTRVADKMTWGVYKPVVRTWTPSDLERKEDPGVGLRWVATDLERKDDTGITMPRDETITTQSFPISSYSFAEVADSAGDIVVQP